MRISGLLCLALSALASLGCATQALGAAPEIAAFRLTDRSGYVALHSRYDATESKRGAGDSSSDSELVFQEEFALDTESYVYHPNFLVMNLSGGLLFDQRSNTRDELSASERNATWNLGARFNFLRRKPYPFSLFFERRNPLLSAGLAGSFTRETTRFGLSASALQPFSPVRLKLDAHRTTSTGEGFGQVVDETVDFLGMSASRSFAIGLQTRLTYELTRAASASGATSLPIIATQRTDHYLNLYSRYDFGAEKQFRLTNISDYRVFQNPDRTDFRVSPSLRWTHSERLDSFYNLRLGKSTQASGDNSEQAAQAGLNLKATKDLRFSADVHGEITKAESRFETRDHGASVGVNYRRPIPFGELRMSHTLRYDSSAQQALATSSDVIGERLSLPGTTLINLARERVIASSVQVSNLTRSQIFAEGIDYRLVVIGSRTNVQRAPGGAIFAGETVLVDYQFELQGTFSYNQLTHSHNVGVTVARYYSFFASYQGQKLSVTSGAPTGRLNPIDLFEVGARADVPVGSRITLGAELRFLRQDEQISPFDRLSLDASVQLKLPLRSLLTVSARRVTTARDRAAEDIELLGFGANLSSRPLHRLNLSASLDYENESSGNNPRTVTRAKLRAGWGLRQLRVSAEAGYLREQVREFNRDDLYMRLTARRDFR